MLYYILIGFLALYLPILVVIIVKKIVIEDIVLWHNHRFHITFLIAWYDLWFGVFVKYNEKTTGKYYYIMIPGCGFTFTWYKHTIKINGKPLMPVKKPKIT